MRRVAHIFASGASTFDNISGVFRISPAAALMRATSSLALFTGVSYTNGSIFAPRRNSPDRKGLAIGENQCTGPPRQSIVHHILHPSDSEQKY
ncbi:hypothetical protein TNCV_4136131 [Trichonephila clavipes]|nr:hypothetical protein TNCV_4136131 [Trichonephila clavipes]